MVPRVTVIDRLHYTCISGSAVLVHADGGTDSLTALIRARQASRGERLGGFFDSLEEKYCAKKPRTSSKKPANASEAGGSSGRKTRGGRQKGQGCKKGKGKRN